MVVLFLLFQLTGHLLPWDGFAVSTAAIEAGIAGNVPVVGPAIAGIVRGGSSTISVATLRAWYAAHVALLPLGLLACALLFLHQFRRGGARLRLPRLATGLTLLGLGVLAVALPMRHGPPATEADLVSYTAQSEWYVVAMHELLVLAQGIRPDLAFLGTVVAPGLAVAFTLALPWLDRKQLGERATPWVMGYAVLAVMGVLGLTLRGLGEMVSPLGPPPRPPDPVAGGTKPPPRLDAALVERGKQLYATAGCGGCHAIGGQGGTTAPPLDEAGQKQPDLEWQVRHLKNPAAAAPGSIMPGYEHLGEESVRALAMYMLSLRGAPPAPPKLDPALVAQGKVVYARAGCVGCHAVGGQGGTSGPPLDGAGAKHPDLEWQLRHLKSPGQLVRGSTMPGYEHLGEADLKALATYMLSLR
jgi:nitric oxide reductase subunit C